MAARVRATMGATLAVALGVASCLGACGSAAPAKPSVVPMADVIPAPVSAHPDPGADFSLTAATVLVSPGGAATTPTDWLAALLRRGTGFSLPVVAPGGHASSRIVLKVDGSDPTIGDHGYILEISNSQVLIRANAGEGLFDGAETLRQLLPATIETAHSPGPWAVEGGQITDYPLYPWRGASLDVARHFFPVSDVERYIDEVALYKIDVLHLHLSDDQGWRIAISAYPTLTSVGGSTAVGGGTGGYYTQAEYQQIVAYAAGRYITVVPEIDMPGHSNAALASLPQLDCGGKVPPVYTGIDSGISTLCVGTAATGQYVSTVLGKLAAITPGPYIDIGGDEDTLISGSEYDAFVNQAAQTVVADGKIPVGWADIATTDDAQGTTATLPTGTLTEYWNYQSAPPDTGQNSSEKLKLIFAPADHAYLDQKYDPGTTLGLDWAGPVSVEQAYDWEPTDYGVPSGEIEGVEAALWSETLTSMADIEYMAFPRLPGIAEIAWSPPSTHSWSAYRERLAAQAPRWQAMGINYYRAPDVPWPS